MEGEDDRLGFICMLLLRVQKRMYIYIYYINMDMIVYVFVMCVCVHMYIHTCRDSKVQIGRVTGCQAHGSI